MKAVAFVDPKIVWREEASSGPTSDATAEQAMPYWIQRAVGHDALQQRPSLVREITQPLKPGS
jgi:hypothetical protein